MKLKAEDIEIILLSLRQTLQSVPDYGRVSFELIFSGDRLPRIESAISRSVQLDALVKGKK